MARRFGLDKRTRELVTDWLFAVVTLVSIGFGITYVVRAMLAG